MRKLALIFVTLLVTPTGALAQAGTVDVRGQILLPSGDYPRNPIRFSISSGDGRVNNDIRFTDSQGRFGIRDLPAGKTDITITVPGDGSTYADTRYNFVPYETSFQGTEVRIILEAIKKVAVDPLATLSAASVYKPLPEAAKSREAALLAIEKEQLEEAEKHLRKAILLDPKYGIAIVDLAALLMQQKRYPEAEQFLRQALEADSKSVLALLNLGITLNRQGKFADAIPHLREALRLEPRLMAAHLNLGIALLETGQLEEAERFLLRAIRTPGPEEVVAQLYLGKLYARTGDWAKGIAALEAYLEKAPTASNAEDVRALLTRLRQEMAARK